MVLCVDSNILLKSHFISCLCWIFFSSRMFNLLFIRFWWILGWNSFKIGMLVSLSLFIPIYVQWDLLLGMLNLHLFFPIPILLPYSFSILIFVRFRCVFFCLLLKPIFCLRLCCKWNHEYILRMWHAWNLQRLHFPIEWSFCNGLSIEWLWLVHRFKIGIRIRQWLLRKNGNSFYFLFCLWPIDLWQIITAGQNHNATQRFATLFDNFQRKKNRFSSIFFFHPITLNVNIDARRETLKSDNNRNWNETPKTFNGESKRFCCEIIFKMFTLQFLVEQ